MVSEALMLNDKGEIPSVLAIMYLLFQRSFVYSSIGLGFSSLNNSWSGYRSFAKMGLVCKASINQI